MFDLIDAMLVRTRAWLATMFDDVMFDQSYGQ